MPAKKKLPELLAEADSEQEAQAFQEKAAAPAPLKAAPKALYAYDEFEIESNGVKVVYLKGERFDIPLGWQRAPQMDELLSASKVKNGAQVGISFTYQGNVINPAAKKEDQERSVHTAVLPLEER